MQMGSRLNINIITDDKIYQNFFLINISFYKYQCPSPIQYYSGDIQKHTETLINHEAYQK